MLDVKRMKMLQEVARHGSFGAAARALSFTPSAVWQQMRALEQQTGLQLFEPGRDGVRLTESGNALLAHADVIVERLGRAEAELTGIARGEAGRVMFGSFPTATTAFVAAATRVFHARHPDVQLHFLDGEPYETVLRLEALELDCAVLFDVDDWPAGRAYDGEFVSDGAGLTYEPLFDDPFLVALPPEHRLAALDTVPVGELADELMLGSGLDCAPWGAALARLCRQEGGEPRFDSRYRTPDFQAVQALVATGRGLSLLPRLALDCVRGDIEIRPLDRAPARHVKLAFPPTSYRSAAAKALAEVVHEVTEMRDRAVSAA